MYNFRWWYDGQPGEDYMWWLVGVTARMGTYDIICVTPAGEWQIAPLEQRLRDIIARSLAF